MYTGEPVFAQVMDHPPTHTLRRCIERYNGHRRVRRFSCRDRFRSMAFARLASRESLRDIGTCPRAQAGRSHHMGFRGQVPRSTLARANGRRDWRIHADFAQSLIRAARGLYADDGFGVDLDSTVHALDSTTIDLCLPVFPRARFRRARAAVRMRALPDPRGNIPTFIDVSPGNRHDVNVPDGPVPEAGAFHVMDRARPGFRRLHHLHLRGGLFVPGAKPDTKLRRLSSRPVDRSTGLVCDQAVRPDGVNSATACPDRLRRIRYRDPERDRTLVFLTNSFALPAMTVADIHRSRWQVEPFFKWIRQHLRIKSFPGTSANAVKTRIRISVSVHVPVAIIRKRLNSGPGLHTILQILDVTCSGRIPLNQPLTDSETTSHQTDLPKKLTLFDF